MWAYALVAFYRENLDFRYASTIPFEVSSMHLRIEYLIKFVFISQGLKLYEMILI